MRDLLGRLGVRGAVVVGLVVLVLGVVAVARLAGSPQGTQSYSSGPQATSTVDPTAGDDGEMPTATASAYPDDKAVKDAVLAFAKAWLRRDLSVKAWHAGITPLATDSVLQSLEGVDPSTVPASRITGDPTIVVRTDGFAKTSLSVDTGTLLLDLTKRDTGWLVESVDWDRL
jgi:hypothetical protein